MADKIANMMTRIVAIGTVEKIEYNSKIGKGIVKGTINCGSNNRASFTMFNGKEDTKAKDMADNVKKGDKIYITGQDNRTYSEEKDTYYEDIMMWDWRPADAEEKSRWVFVYIGDVLSIEDSTLNLKFIDYRDNEMDFPIDISNAEFKGDNQEIVKEGCRIKVKGEIFVGREEDYYGDLSEFVVKRTAAQIELLNTAEEIAADSEEGSSGKDELWS